MFIGKYDVPCEHSFIFFSFIVFGINLLLRLLHTSENNIVMKIPSKEMMQPTMLSVRQC